MENSEETYAMPLEIQELLNKHFDEDWGDLAHAVVRQMEIQDMEQLKSDAYDISHYSITGGYHGFTATYDLCIFYDQNAGNIWNLLCELADTRGCEDALDFVRKTKLYKNYCPTTDDNFKELMVWIAASFIMAHINNVFKSKEPRK